MPRYSKEFISEIKSRLSVSEVVGKFVKLTQRGNEYVGLSPFKNEKTPSFTVNDEKEFYHCFSSAEHGDIFSFLMKHKNMSYPDSIEYLAKQAGMDPQKGVIQNPNYVEKDFSSLRKIMIEVNNYYKTHLKNNTHVKKYLDGRNITNKTIEKFELGYSSNLGNDLFNFLKSKDIKIDDAVSLGLIKKSNRNEQNYYDFFRNRLMFPIKDYKSNIIAFGGRTLDNSIIKYINSSDSPIFKKSYHLFNLDVAIENNRKLKDLIIVEGYMDVISLYQNGFTSTVAPLGTAVTSYQLNRAWKVCESPIIMFDGDEAGQKAAQRVAKLALSNLMPDLSVRICILPKDYDPDDFITNYGSPALQKLLDNSLSLSEFIWKIELEKEDISIPEKKAGFEQRIKSILRNINNQIVKEYYQNYFLDKLGQLKSNINRQNFIYKKRSVNKVSKEVIASERASKGVHESSVREKIIIICLIQNPFLLSRYTEDLGKIKINDHKLSVLVSEILEFYSSKGHKDLEKYNLKSYLVSRGLEQEINYIYQPRLLETYNSIINNNEEAVEKGFVSLLDLHNNLLDENDLNFALNQLEENMDEKSFENFMKIKKESLNKS